LCGVKFDEVGNVIPGIDNPNVGAKAGGKQGYALVVEKKKLEGRGNGLVGSAGGKKTR